MSISVLLADDHKIFRDGLAALLEGQKEFRIVGEADNGRTAVKLAEQLSPDVVVMDVAMPDLNGVDATQQIKARKPSCKVIVLSADGSQETAANAISVGASGFVSKDSAFQELATAIHAVASGEVYLGPNVAGALLERMRNGSAADGCNGQRDLSPRQREVLQLLAEGHATKEVAFHLHVSVKTAETHRRQIMEKLNLQSVAELTKYAIRQGITSL